jgi:hypothetical protein
MFNIFPHEREKTCTLQRIRDYLFIQLSPSPPITVVIQWESVIHCRKNSSLCAEHAAVSFIHCTEREIESKSHFVLLEGPLVTCPNFASPKAVSHSLFFLTNLHPRTTLKGAFYIGHACREHLQQCSVYDLCTTISHIQVLFSSLLFFQPHPSMKVKLELHISGRLLIAVNQ